LHGSKKGVKTTKTGGDQKVEVVGVGDGRNKLDRERRFSAFLGVGCIGPVNY
jgi:hypothetical protein